MKELEEGVENLKRIQRYVDRQLRANCHRVSQRLLSLPLYLKHHERRKYDVFTQSPI